jgi:hypothetical protein
MPDDASGTVVAVARRPHLVGVAGTGMPATNRRNASTTA